MNLTIYRAWDTDALQYVDCSNHTIAQINNNYGGLSNKYVYEQNSAISDDDGKEIFDGDRVLFEIIGTGYGYGRCYMGNGCFWIDVEGQKMPLPLYEYVYRKDIVIIVIGNIHQAP